MDKVATLKSIVAGLPVERSLAETSVPAAPSVEIRIARSFAEVEELRQIWSAWPSHRDSDIDFCLEFAWTRKEVIRPHVIVIYRQGQAEAMLVGRMEYMQLDSKIGYLRLPGISAHVLIFSYGGLLGNPSVENSRELMRSILKTLRQGEADMAMLDHLRTGSPLYEEALCASGFATRDHIVTVDPHSLMVLPANVEELYRGFSPGLRAETRRKKKKVFADFGGNVEVHAYHQLDEVDQVVPMLEEVAKGTYQRGLGVGFRDTEQMRHRLRFCARKGWLRIYVLTIGGKPCAFWIGTLSNQLFVSDYNAYDPKFRDYSVGTFLLVSVVEEFCKEGVKAIDFGFGQAEYKERFGNSRLMEASVYVFAPKAKAILLNAMRTFTGLVDNSARKLLEGTRLLPTIKKFWRSRRAKTTAAG